MDYFAPKHQIIGTKNFNKDSEETQVYTFDGNAVKIPTGTINDHYEAVHISESLEDYYKNIDLAQVYAEMNPIYKGLDDSFHNAEVSALNGYEDMLKKNN